MSAKVLVIGANGKYRNCDVYSWRRLEKEKPLLGDFHDVIIYLPNLMRGQTFENEGLASSVLHYLRTGVVDALNGQTHIYFVIAPPEQFPNVSSYSLIPFSIQHDIENGKNVKRKETQTLPYLAKISGWQVAFRDNPNSFSTNGLTHKFVILARTNHEKNAAYRINFTNQQSGQAVGVVDVIPPLMSNGSISEEKSVQELLDYLVPVENSNFELPEKVAAVNLPGESELRQENSSLEQTIKDAQQRMAEIHNDLDEYEKLKGIIAFKGKTLEQCVDIALAELGIDYVPTNSNLEDGTIGLQENYDVPVEIKGHENKGSSERDLRQLIVRLTDDTADKAVRGVLIVNPFFNISKQEAEKMKVFESSVIQQAKAFKIVLVDTRILLKYVAEHLKNDSNLLLAELLTTSGELKFKKNADTN